MPHLNSILPIIGFLLSNSFAQVGPFYPVPESTLYIKHFPREFVHPGLLHTAEDFARIRKFVFEEPTEPWISAFANFSGSQYAQSDYVQQGPATFVERGNPSSASWSQFKSDGVAAYQNALMYAITGDKAHANKSISLQIAWASTLTLVNGTDSMLSAGLDGFIWANAAELMRHLGPMGTTDYAAVTAMLFRAVAPAAVPIGQSNYGIAGIQGLLSISVTLDDVTMWNSAIRHAIQDPCAGIPSQFHPDTGQNVESGRDQGHVQDGINWISNLMKIAENQGFPEIWRTNDDLFLKGLEYTATYNLGASVPYDPTWFRCEAVLVEGPWENISSLVRGELQPVWELPYSKYATQLGLEAPTTKRVIDMIRPETMANPNSITDFSGWGTLMFNLAPSNDTADSTFGNG